MLSSGTRADSSACNSLSQTPIARLASVRMSKLTAQARLVLDVEVKRQLGPVTSWRLGALASMLSGRRGALA